MSLVVVQTDRSTYAYKLFNLDSERERKIARELIEEHKEIIMSRH